MRLTKKRQTLKTEAIWSIVDVLESNKCEWLVLCQAYLAVVGYDETYQKLSHEAVEMNCRSDPPTVKLKVK